LGIVPARGFVPLLFTGNNKGGKKEKKEGKTKEGEEEKGGPTPRSVFFFRTILTERLGKGKRKGKNHRRIADVHRGGTPTIFKVLEEREEGRTLPALRMDGFANNLLWGPEKDS